MKPGFIGPHVREYTRPRRKVCNLCIYCTEWKNFGQRSHELIGASCKHPDRPKTFLGHELEVSGDDVLWPDDCPQPEQVFSFSTSLQHKSE